MDRILYLVAQIQGHWFVQLKDQRFGPYRTQELAVADAVRGAQTVPNSQVGRTRIGRSEPNGPGGMIRHAGDLAGR